MKLFISYRCFSKLCKHEGKISNKLSLVLCAVLLTGAAFYFFPNKNSKIAQIDAQPVLLGEFQSFTSELSKFYPDPLLKNRDSKRVLAQFFVDSKVILYAVKSEKIIDGSCFLSPLSVDKLISCTQSARKAITRKYLPSESEITRHFKSNPSYFGERVRMDVESVKTASLEKAEIARKLFIEGRSCGEVSKGISEDIDILFHGCTHSVFSNMPSIYSEIATPLKEQEVSAPRLDGNHYFVVKKLNHMKLTSQLNEETKKEIIARIQDSKFNEWLQSKKNEYNVKIYLKKIKGG